MSLYLPPELKKAANRKRVRFLKYACRGRLVALANQNEVSGDRLQLHFKTHRLPYAIFERCQQTT
jgi:hypothetical protein